MWRKTRRSNSHTDRLGISLIQLLGILGVLFVIVAMFLPIRRDVREAARRSSCRNNLKQIGIALHAYAAAQGGFPPPFIVDAESRRLHSWRTLLLPYLDQQALYDSIDLTKPWNDPANATAAGTEVDVYKCPSAKLQKFNTTYLGIVGKEAAFHPERSRLAAEFSDGISATALIVDVTAAEAVHWMAPQDISASELLERSAIDGEQHEGVFSCLTGDGRIISGPKTTPFEQLQAVITIAGNDSNNLDF